MLPLGLALLLAQGADADVGAGAEPTVKEEPPRKLTEKDLVEGDDYQLRLSLPTEEDFQAWRSSGFRVQLGIGYGNAKGRGESVADFSSTVLILRPQVRLDDAWSIAASFAYDLTGGDLDGLRWSAALEPVFHVVAGLSLSLGIGYAGIDADRVGGAPSGYQLVIERPDATVSREAGPDEALAECTGGGWLALGRVDYQFVVGPLFATGPFLRGDYRWTRCSQEAGPTNNETGRPVEVRQWWQHASWSVGWLLTWR